MVAANQDEQARRRFPALDPEPPPRPWWQRVIVPGAVIGVAAAAAVAIWLWPSSHGTQGPAGGSPTQVITAGGHVVVQMQDGSLSLADPDGRHRQPLKALGSLRGGPISVAPDSRYLALGDGEVVTISGGRPVALASTKINPSSTLTAVFPDAFTDHDRAIVFLSGEFGPTSTAPVIMSDLATGRQVPLGTGDQVAGDPQAPGAFVSVAAPVQPSATVPTYRLLPDARVELRDAGHRPVRLVTARQVNNMLGQPLSQQITLIPFPDPSGDKVAVVAYALAGGPTGAIVVLDRAGHLLDSVPAVSGPLLDEALAWSPNGQSLAFPTTGNSGPALSVLTISRQTLITPFPDPTYSYALCLWSPDGGETLCDAYRPAHPGQRWWAIASARGGTPMAWVAAPGAPIAWLASAGSR